MATMKLNECMYVSPRSRDFDAHAAYNKHRGLEGQTMYGSWTDEKYLKSDASGVQESLPCNTDPTISVGLSTNSDRTDIFTDPDRIWSNIHLTANWGALPDRAGGMSRLALSQDDCHVRDWFQEEARKIGCEITVDTMGNIFAVLPGEKRELPPIAIGSHLDTQPAGGRFDGILGVIGALEILRTIRASGRKTYASVVAIDWTNEEGARFSPGCTGAAVWAGHTSLTAAHTRPSNCGTTTLGTELSRIAYLGTRPASHTHNPFSAHFELHIEQGRRLQDARKSIGIVTAIQGIRWYNVTVTGERAHSSTPIHLRADALVAASKIIIFLEEIAREKEASATVGTFEVKSASPNVVSGCVQFTIDIRHPSEAILTEIEVAIQQTMDKLSEQKRSRIAFETGKVWHSPALAFHEKVVGCLRDAAASVFEEGMVMREMRSFAGHDSALVAMTGTPTAMLFVPSKDGVSHAPEEWTSKEECGRGVEVLYRAVRNFDDHLRGTA